MPKTVRTFGQFLRQFARSVDLVDEDTIGRVRRLVYDYVRGELEIGFFSVATSQEVNDQPGLRTVWATQGPTRATAILNADGGYESQISVSYAERTPLWIVSADRGPLRQAAEYIEMWSDWKELPRYRAPVNQDMRTSIVVPLVHFGTPIGVIYLESLQYLEISEVAKDELSLLADSLGILFDLRATNAAQVSGTRDAIDELQAVLSSATFPLVTTPQVFIASSGRADDEVMGVIQEVLDAFSSTLKIVQWNRIEASGSITSQIIAEIARSRFGICYLSEPAAEGAAPAYQDNPNVLFESGMLHALTNAPTGQPTGWIPVREADSSRIPFDFASERVEIVPRGRGGDLQRERFRVSLRRRVESLLGEVQR